MKLSPTYLFLNYTTLCNSRCLTCSLWRQPNVTLPPEVVGRVGNFLRPDNLREVFFTGGEPFLPKTAVETAVAMHRFCPGVAVTAATNAICPGLYLSRITEMIREGIWINVVASLNGLPATHDRTRGIAGNYDATLEMLTGLRRLGALVAVNLLEIPAGFLAGEPGTTDADRQHVKEVAARYEVPVWRSPILRKMPWFGVLDDGATIPPFDCHGGGEVLCILPSGDITACQEPRPELVFANLRDEGEISDERAARIQQAIRRRQCQPCGCCTAAFTQGLRCVT